MCHTNPLSTIKCFRLTQDKKTPKNLHVVLKITQLKKKNSLFLSNCFLLKKNTKSVAVFFPEYLEYLRGGAAC